MPIIGTAGHVDHGKSTLIRALTGRDPDRWAEEKDRGLTIDLGFAWTTIGGHDVSFVDVPGHERFLKNMLAGVDPIDIALLVVAADEGWSAQSEEHLVILDLLGIHTAVIALTKTDRVDPELVELAALEVEERLEGTGLAGSPIIPVSGATGAGLDDLIAALEGALGSLGPPRQGRPTLWVDRAFSVPGAGTVVTGSLSGGSVTVDDVLELQPSGDVSRVRSIQSHEQEQEAVGPQRRVALGVPDLERRLLVRGSVLTAPGTRGTTTSLLVDLRPARGHDETHLQRGAFHLHLGSGDWPARMRPLEGGAAIVLLSDPVPAISGDRFILRDAGRRAVVAGGVVLDPAPDRRSRRAVAAAATLRTVVGTGPDDLAQALLSIRGVARLDALAAWTGGGQPREGVRAGETMIDTSIHTALIARANNLVGEYHAAFPLREGIPKSQLASALGIGLETLDTVIDAAPELRPDGAFVARGEHRPQLDAASEKHWQTVRATLTSAGLAPPRATEAVPDEELRHLLVRLGHVVAVGEFLYLPATLDSIRSLLETLQSPFSAAQAKEAMGVSRKHAIPLLEWCDSHGVTRRTGADRELR